MNAEGLMAIPVDLGGRRVKSARSQEAGTPAEPGDADRIMGFGRDPGDHGPDKPAYRKRCRVATEGDLHLDLY